MAKVRSKKICKATKLIDRVVSNGDELAKMLNTTPKTISMYVSLGLPRKEDNTFDIIEVLQFLVGKKAGSLSEIEYLKKDILHLNSELKELQLQREKGVLVNVSDLNQQFTHVGSALKEQLERVCINHPDSAQAIKDAINNVLTQLDFSVDNKNK